MFNIGDAQGFSGIASIAPSRGFSGRTLTGVWLYYRRLSQIGVFPSWKIEHPDSYITATWMHCEKGGHHGRQACIVDVEKIVSLQRCILWIGRLSIWHKCSKYL